MKEFRNNAFHTLLFVLAMVLQYRLHLCWGAPVTVSIVSAVEDDINSNTTIINGTLTATATVSSSEEQGDEFADLQELRSGLKVLNTIAVSESEVAVVKHRKYACTGAESCSSPTHSPTLHNHR